MNVLIVEDDLNIGPLVQRLLNEDGHQAEIVTSGSGALTASLMHEYDLLICDLMLPDLQGTELVRALKAQSPRLPVIVMSALNADEWAQPCEDAGATRYLEKPLDIEALRDEIKLVEKARLHLSIAIIDADPIHATHLNKTLQALGCQVSVYGDIAAATSGITAGDPAGLLVVDAGLDGAADLISWAKDRGVPTFAVCDPSKENIDDVLMRAGAAFILGKPVNVDSLLTQASFMVAM